MRRGPTFFLLVWYLVQGSVLVLLCAPYVLIDIGTGCLGVSSQDIGVAAVLMSDSRHILIFDNSSAFWAALIFPLQR